MIPFPALAVLALAPQVTNLTATHVDGQTFLVWDEVANQNTEYKVYRAASTIRSAGDLAGADVLGTVDERTSLNRRRTLVEGQNRYWVIPGGTLLVDSQGLFVHTLEAAGDGAYAVTTITNGVEDTTIDVGQNSLRRPLSETPAPPQPVLQNASGSTELWAHWGGDRPTPFLPKLSIRPSQGYNFQITPGTQPGPRGLLLRLHAAGQTYASGFPARFEVPQDVDILATDDWFFFTGFSFWFGAHEDHPFAPSAGTKVGAFTLERTKWTLDWTQAHLGPDHDPERVSIAGGSMGAIGAMYLANEWPETFSAILCRNGNFDWRVPDLGNPALIQDLYGPFADNLLTTLGIPVYDRMDAGYMARLDPGRDWPMLRTINGRNDTTVGWRSAHALFGATEETRRPAAHYFDERIHNPFGTWKSVEGRLITRTTATRRDLPVLRFSGFSQDEDAGDGDPLSGDVVGTLGGRIEQDQTQAAETADSASFVVFLRDEGSDDDALAPTGTVRLTPRRLHQLALAPGDPVRFELTEDGLLEDEHLLFADADGLVETPPTPVSLTPRTVLFERLPAVPLSPGPGYERLLYVEDAPRPGEDQQVVVFGPPSRLFGVAVGLRAIQANTRWGVLLIGDLDIFATGFLDPNGLAETSLPIPNDPALGGLTLYYQALIYWQLSNRETVTIR